MKKIVAMLLIIATLIVPFCGLADMEGTVEKIFDLTDSWLPVGTISSIPNDGLYLMWMSAEECFALIYNQKGYVYLGSQADLLMAACASIANVDDSLTYGTDWFFVIDSKYYSDTQVALYVLRVADKYKD